MMSLSRGGGAFDAATTVMPSSVATAAGAASTQVGDGSVSLATLIEFIVQRTYHELTVLAELLPRKTDMERKIEIVRYASRTRQLCVRLLALVKWAGSVSKVDKSAGILAFLDKQSLLFVDTADSLALMARQDLNAARLPVFNVPVAVELLTTGSYSRLPLCVRQRIVPERTVTANERRSTLLRLNQVIEQRLAWSPVPPQMLQLRIADGRVRMTVADEFSITLTLLGDGSAVPWTLLDIEVLVQDPEAGQGRALVHPLQMRYLHQLVESYLAVDTTADVNRPLYDVYRLLHSLCQSLQLEVLHAQLLQLVRRRLGDSVRVEQYQPGGLLALSYWRHATPASSSGYTAASSYRLQIEADSDSSAGLRVGHTPPLPGADAGLALSVVRSGGLSLERLIVATVQLRSRTLLHNLRQLLCQQLCLPAEQLQLQNCHQLPRLVVPLLLPVQTAVAAAAECLTVYVHVERGVPACQLPDCVPSELVEELSSVLAAAASVAGGSGGGGDSGQVLARLSAILTRLRFALVLHRAQRTLEYFPASVHEHMALWWPRGSPLQEVIAAGSSGEHQLLYVRLHRHPSHMLVMVATPTRDKPCQLNYRIYVASVRECSDVRASSAAVSSSQSSSQANDQIICTLPNRCLKVLTCVELDTFLFDTGDTVDIDNQSETDAAAAVMTAVVPGKRPLMISSESWPAIGDRKRLRTGSSTSGGDGGRRHHQLPLLASAVTLCDQLVSFAALCSLLSDRGVTHDGAPLPGRCHYQQRRLRLLQLPTPVGVSRRHVRRLQRQQLLSATVCQLQDKQGWRWTVQYVMWTGEGGLNTSTTDRCCRRVVCFSYSQSSAGGSIGNVVDRLLADWHKMAALYSLLVGFRGWHKRYGGNSNNGGGAAEMDVQVSNFSYKTLTLAYGTGRWATVSVDFCPDLRRFRLIFGVTARSSVASNPHTLLTNQMEELLNDERWLPQLAVVLHHSLAPLSALCQLCGASGPRLGVRGDRPLEPLCDFLLLPQSPWLVRLVYRRVYCVSVCVLSGGQVALRDGAFSGVERGRQLEELVPVPSLATFLARRRGSGDPSMSYTLSADCDVLPSPAPMELDLGSAAPVMQQPVMSMPKPTGICGSPAAARDARFAHPMTPGSSNPHTPASPLQPSPATVASSSSAAAAGQMVAHSPSASMLHAPSPGGFMPAPSPGHVGHSPAAAAMSPFAASQQSLNSPAMSCKQQHVTSQSQLQQQQQHLSTSSSSQPAAYTASQVVILSCDALHALCARVRLAGDSTPASPLERFFGCVYTRNHLRRTLDEESVSNIMRLPSNEHGTIVFRTGCLQCRVRLDPERMQSLHLSLQPVPETLDQWTPDQLHVLERFFDAKVAIPPYRQNTLKTFVRILNTQANVLRDFIRIMQLEEMTLAAGGGGAQQQQLNTNWTVEWCTTSPPAVPALIPTGVVSLMNAGAKLLFFVQLTRRSQPSAAVEPVRLVLPIVYNIQENLTQCADRKDVTPSQVTTLVNHMMRRSSEAAIQAGECSVFPAVRDVVHSLTLPAEQQQQHVMSADIQQQQQQQMSAAAAAAAGVQSQLPPSAAQRSFPPQPTQLPPSVMQQQQLRAMGAGMMPLQQQQGPTGYGAHGPAGP